MNSALPNIEGQVSHDSAIGTAIGVRPYISQALRKTAIGVRPYISQALRTALSIVRPDPNGPNGTNGMLLD